MSLAPVLTSINAYEWEFLEDADGRPVPFQEDMRAGLCEALDLLTVNASIVVLVPSEHAMHSPVSFSHQGQELFLQPSKAVVSPLKSMDLVDGLYFRPQCQGSTKSGARCKNKTLDIICVENRQLSFCWCHRHQAV